MIRHIFVSGRVQGVGFRNWIVRETAKIGDVSGWVRNIGDGRVEMMIETSPENMEKLVMRLYKGPLFARVDEINVLNDDISVFPEIKSGKFEKIASI